jgi:hypothetical protein
MATKPVYKEFQFEHDSGAMYIKDNILNFNMLYKLA